MVFSKSAFRFESKLYAILEGKAYLEIYLTHSALIEVRIALLLSSLEMESATRVQILDVAVCVSLRPNVIGKVKNPCALSIYG